MMRTTSTLYYKVRVRLASVKSKLTPPAVAGWPGEFVVLPAERAPDHLRMPGNLEQHWVVDTTRSRRELGVHEPVGREEAIRRTILWERAVAAGS